MNDLCVENLLRYGLNKHFTPPAVLANVSTSVFLNGTFSWNYYYRTFINLISQRITFIINQELVYIHTTETGAAFRELQHYLFLTDEKNSCKQRTVFRIIPFDVLPSCEVYIAYGLVSRAMNYCAEQKLDLERELALYNIDASLKHT